MELTGFHALIMYAVANAFLMLAFIGVILYYFCKSYETSWKDIWVTTLPDTELELYSSWFRTAEGTIFKVRLSKNASFEPEDAARAVKAYAEQLGYVVTEVAIEGKVIGNADKGRVG